MDDIKRMCAKAEVPTKKTLRFEIEVDVLVQPNIKFFEEGLCCLTSLIGMTQAGKSAGGSDEDLKKTVVVLFNELTERHNEARDPLVRVLKVRTPPKLYSLEVGPP